MNSISTVWAELHRRYAAGGMEIVGGYSPFLVQNSRSAPFNYIQSQGILKSTSGGIANDEAQFLYSLCDLTRPERILVIGNSYGFSSVFLSLANPEAKLLAFDKFRTRGIEVTQDLLSDMEYKYIVQGSTPEDIPRLVTEYLDGRVDLILVDAVHTNEMQNAEWPAYLPFLTEKAIVCFHDVVSCGLVPSFESLRQANKEQFKFCLASKTSSGMGLAVRKQVHADNENFFTYFCQPVERALSFGSYCSRNFNEPVSDLAALIEIKELERPPHPQL